MRPRTDIEIELTFVRHGMIKGNMEHRYIGKTEEALCAKGREELKGKKAHLRDADKDVKVVFVSPMRRCLESAEILYPGKKYVAIPEWREMDFGLFEGKNYKDLEGNADYQKWIDSNGTLPFPGGESREKFKKRVEQGFLKMIQILKENEEKPYRAAAVVHGGTIMALLSLIDGGDYFSYQVKNGEGYRCIYPFGSEEKYVWKVEKI